MIRAFVKQLITWYRQAPVIIPVIGQLVTWPFSMIHKYIGGTMSAVYEYSCMQKPTKAVVRSFTWMSTRTGRARGYIRHKLETTYKYPLVRRLANAVAVIRSPPWWIWTVCKLVMIILLGGDCHSYPSALEGMATFPVDSGLSSLPKLVRGRQPIWTGIHHANLGFEPL